MARRGAAAIVAALASLAVGACSGSGDPGGVTVGIETFAYAPASISVEAGETVTWINRDAVPHTVTASDGSWDSGSIPPGGEWTWTVTPGATGGYKCTFHPTMTGTLEIE